MTFRKRRTRRRKRPSRTWVRYTAERQTPRYKKGFPMTVAVPTITDVVFDFCGVLLDWRTRTCREGRFDDATVDRICADDDPCGFFGYEDRMTPGRGLRFDMARCGGRAGRTRRRDLPLLHRALRRRAATHAARHGAAAARSEGGRLWRVGIDELGPMRRSISHSRSSRSLPNCCRAPSSPAWRRCTSRTPTSTNWR